MKNLDEITLEKSLLFNFNLTVRSASKSLENGLRPKRLSRYIIVNIK